MKLRHVSIRITDACNLKCEGCYVIQDNRYMSINNYKEYILPNICKLGVKSIGLTGGEPLLHNDLLSFIVEAKKYGLVTSLVTNGTLLSDIVLDNLIDSDLDKLQISLNSLDKDDYTKNMEVDEFERLVQEIIPGVCDKGIPLTLVAVPGEKLYVQMEQYVNYAIEKGVSAIYFRRKIGSRNSIIDSAIQNKQFIKRILEMQNKYGNSIKIMCGDPLFLVMKATQKEISIERLYSGCSAGVTSLAIGTTGNIYPCTRTKYVLGNVFKDDLGVVWNENETLLRLQRRDLEGKCSKCDYRLLCGGCRAEALINENNIFAPDSLCSNDVLCVE